MDQNIWTVVVSTIGGLVTGFFAFKIKFGASKRNDFSLIIETMRGQLDDLSKENARLRAENELQRKEIDKLKTHVREIDIELRVLRAGYFESPLATWVKNEKGEMLFLSKEYEKKFLRPIGKKRADYIGNDDYAIWGQKTGDQFIEHDELVRSTGKVWVGVESFEMKNGNNLFENYYFMKYPFDPDGKGIIKGHVAGIAFPLTDEVVKHIVELNEK